jgi:hypothetical protein
MDYSALDYTTDDICLLPGLPLDLLKLINEYIIRFPTCDNYYKVIGRDAHDFKYPIALNYNIFTCSCYHFDVNRFDKIDLPAQICFSGDISNIILQNDLKYFQVCILLNNDNIETKNIYAQICNKITNIDVSLINIKSIIYILNNLTNHVVEIKFDSVEGFTELTNNVFPSVLYLRLYNCDIESKFIPNIFPNLEEIIISLPVNFNLENLALLKKIKFINLQFVKTLYCEIRKIFIDSCILKIGDIANFVVVMDDIYVPHNVRTEYFNREVSVFPNKSRTWAFIPLNPIAYDIIFPINKWIKKSAHLKSGKYIIDLDEETLHKIPNNEKHMKHKLYFEV